MNSPAHDLSEPTMTIAEADAIISGVGMIGEIEEVVIDGHSVRTWKNAPKTLRDVLAASRLHGDKVFLVYGDERIDFDTFHRAVAATAIALKDRGIAKGDRVAIIMRNLPEWPVAFYAAAAIGAIVTPLNAWCTGDELQYTLHDSGAKAVVVDESQLEKIRDQLGSCPALEHVIVSRKSGQDSLPQVTRLEDILGEPGRWSELRNAEVPDVALAPDDPATIFYTSGTTGKPKGVLGTHRGCSLFIISGTIAGQRAVLRSGGSLPLPPPPPEAPQFAVLLAIPFFHVSGTMTALNPCCFNGGKIVLMHRWDAVRGLELIEKERITLVGGVPTIAWELLEHPARGEYDLSSIGVVSYGGAPSGAELPRRTKEVFPAAATVTGWGMTETSALGTAVSGDDLRRHPGTCGAPLPIADVKITRGELSDELPIGEIGEMWCRGAMVTRQYWNAPEATRSTIVDGWLRTGDIARLDEDGFCYIVDRAKDMLIRGGENIYCVEVENALYEHPAVMDAGLIGLPHRTLGEVPAAVVSLVPGSNPTEEELRAFVAARLAKFKVPVAIRIHPEMLPRNANGKIMKPDLKKMFADTPVDG